MKKNVEYTNNTNTHSWFRFFDLKKIQRKARLKELEREARNLCDPMPRSTLDQNKKCFDMSVMQSWRKSVSWCFEPSRPLGIILGLKANFNPCLSYSACKSFNTNHNIFSGTVISQKHTWTVFFFFFFFLLFKRIFFF